MPDDGTQHGRSWTFKIDEVQRLRSPTLFTGDSKSGAGKQAVTRDDGSYSQVLLILWANRLPFRGRNQRRMKCEASAL